MRTRLAPSLLAGVLAAGCADPPQELVVTVEAQPSVHDAKTLHVTLANAGGTVSQDLDLGAHAFPVTFGVQATGRTGDLAIAVDALDQNMLVVGRGAGTSAVTDPAATVKLEGADFVVNTEFADDQLATSDFETYGFQLGATADGSWLASYHGTCSAPCNMFGRRFDATGKPLTSEVAASTNAFPITTTLTSGSPNTAIATTGSSTLALWDFQDSVANTSGVACRSFDAQGNATPTQTQISSDAGTDVVGAATLSNSNVAVSWVASLTTTSIRGAIVQPDCTRVLGPFTVNTTTTGFIHRPTLGVSGDVLMYAWIVDGTARFHVGTNGGSFPGPDAVLLAATATEQVEQVRIAPFAGAFAVAVRWGPLTGAGQSRIEVYKADKTGKLMGTPTVVTSVAIPDFETVNSFGLAPRADGALLVVWHECNGGGDGNGCGVFGRVLRPSGVPVGDKIVIPTTTLNDQTTPSAVALPGAWAVSWTDKSAAEPDHSGLAVRARIFAPPYDDASGIQGATCSAAAPCGTGLACAMGGDGARCYETCTPPTCANGGSCRPALDGSNACVF